jgi:hypothetical protein
VGFVVGKMALGQVSPQLLQFSPVSFFPPVLNYTEKRKNPVIFTNGCTVSLKAAVRP